MISCAKLAQLGVVLPDPPAPRLRTRRGAPRGGLRQWPAVAQRQSHDHRSGDIRHLTRRSQACRPCMLRALSAIDQALGLENVEAQGKAYVL